MSAVSTLHSICITPWMTRRCSMHSLTTRLICWFAAANLPTDSRLTAPAALQPLKKPRQTQLQHKFPAMSATAAASPWVGRRSLLKLDVTFFCFFFHSWPLLANLPTWCSHPVSSLPSLSCRLPQRGSESCLGGCHAPPQPRQANLKTAASRQAGRQHTSPTAFKHTHTLM